MKSELYITKIKHIITNFLLQRGRKNRESESQKPPWRKVSTMVFWAWTSSKQSKHKQSFVKYTHKQQMTSSSTSGPSSHPSALGSNFPSQPFPICRNLEKMATMIAFLSVCSLSFALQYYNYQLVRGFGMIRESEFWVCFCF